MLLDLASRSHLFSVTRARFSSNLTLCSLNVASINIILSNMEPSSNSSGLYLGMAFTLLVAHTTDTDLLSNNSKASTMSSMLNSFFSFCLDPTLFGGSPSIMGCSSYIAILATDTSSSLKCLRHAFRSFVASQEPL